MASDVALAEDPPDADHEIGSEEDAEGEDDMDIEYSATTQTRAGTAPRNGSSKGRASHALASDDEDRDARKRQNDSDALDADAGALEEADAELEDGDTVGAVKVPEESDSEAAADEPLNDGSDADGSEAAASAASDDDDSASATAPEWEQESAGADEGEDIGVASRNNCVYSRPILSGSTVKISDPHRFCGQDEEHDPSEEFEEYLACSVCGDNAHRQCAREANSLSTDDEAERWRCLTCVHNALEPDNASTADLRRLSSSSRLTRDLLAGPRGGNRPGAHSVFNTLILDDDPLDGSRALRKRKTSSASAEEPSKPANKKRKQVPSDGSDVDADAEPLRSVRPGQPALEAPSKALLRSTRSPQARAPPSATPLGRPSRAQRPTRRDAAQLARVVTRNTLSFIVAMKVNASRLKIKKPKPQKKAERRTSPLLERPPNVTPRNTYIPTPLFPLHDREVEELKSKPYGGILTDAEADTTKTLPASPDRLRFEIARRKAEEDWKIKTAAAEPEGEARGRPSQKISGPPSKIKYISFGGYEVETWYAAPYPEEYSRNRVLYICEFCLKYMNSDYVAWRHKLKCAAKHPPGDEIYREKSISVFEVDGRKNPAYCQNLCLLAKLFLGSKTLYYDVEPFLFYIMTEYDELGCHFVGYFSKEKRPSSMNNVSCILTLPIHQRKGYGHLLIDFSYLLTRVERKTGSPEKPLSDMGLVSYRNYWRLILCELLLDQKDPLSISTISDRTGMTADDIVAALEALHALVRDPVTKSYAFRLDLDYYRQCVSSWQAKQYVRLNPDALIWTPYVMSRGNLANYDRAPPISTVAPREDEDEEEDLALGNKTDAAVEPLKSLEDAEIIQDPLSTTANDFDMVSMKMDKDAIPPTPDVVPAGELDEAKTPILNGIHHSKATPREPTPPSPIPPTRYEIFPPLPSSAPRRRGGPGRGGHPRRSHGASGVAMPLRRAPSSRLTNGIGLGVNGILDRALSPARRSTRHSAMGAAMPLTNGIADERHNHKADSEREHGLAPGSEDVTMKDGSDADAAHDSRASAGPSDAADPHGGSRSASDDAEAEDDFREASHEPSPADDDASYDAEADADGEPDADADADADGDVDIEDDDLDAEGEDDDLV